MRAEVDAQWMLLPALDDADCGWRLMFSCTSCGDLGLVPPPIKAFPYWKKERRLKPSLIWTTADLKTTFLDLFYPKTATPGLPAGDGFELLRRRSSHLVSVALKCLKSISAAERQSDGSKNKLLFQD